MAKRRSGNYLLRLSITLMVIGYGSIPLSSTDFQFTLLSWANGMQPWVGLVVGTIGLGFLVVPLIMARTGRSGSFSPAAHIQQQQGFGYGAQQQPYGAPQQQFAQQPYPGQPYAHQPQPQQFQPQQPQPQQPQQFQPQQAQQPQPFQPQPGFAQQPGFTQQPQPGFAAQQNPGQNYGANPNFGQQPNYGPPQG